VPGQLQLVSGADRFPRQAGFAVGLLGKEEKEMLAAARMGKYRVQLSSDDQLGRNGRR